MFEYDTLYLGEGKSTMRIKVLISVCGGRQSSYLLGAPGSVDHHYHGAGAWSPAGFAQGVPKSLQAEGQRLYPVKVEHSFGFLLFYQSPKRNVTSEFLIVWTVSISVRG